MVGEPILSRSLELEILGRNRIDRGKREDESGGRRCEVHAQFVRGLQIPGRAPQPLPLCRNDRNRASISISFHQLQLVALGHLGR